MEDGDSLPSEPENKFSVSDSSSCWSMPAIRKLLLSIMWEPPALARLPVAGGTDVGTDCAGCRRGHHLFLHSRRCCALFWLHTSKLRLPRLVAPSCRQRRRREMGCGASSTQAPPPVAPPPEQQQCPPPEHAVAAERAVAAPETEAEYEEDFEEDFEEDLAVPEAPANAAESEHSTAHAPITADARPIIAAEAEAEPAAAAPIPVVDASIAEAPDENPPRPAAEAPWSLITLEELKLSGDVLGSGGNGTVHSAQWQGQLVAVKTLKDATAGQLAAIEAELLVQAHLDHVGIVRLLGACLVPPSCCIVLEHCATSLFARLYKDPATIERRWSLDVTTRVAEGMAYLHSRSPCVIHRDLKSPNVLLMSDGRTPKICDFGLVGVREVTAGTPNYMAPELLEAKAWSWGVDVFAFGVLLNEVFAREVPWDGYQPFDIKQQVVSGKRPRTALTMPFTCERLLQKAWHQDAASRPTFEEAIIELHAAVEAIGGAASHDLPPLPPDSLDALM